MSMTGPTGCLALAATPAISPRFLRNVSFFIGCEWFRRSPYNISSVHFREIFDDYFTQYFPHEHLDFPPWPHGSPWQMVQRRARAGQPIFISLF
jgi:hypothetical protein